MSIDRKFRRLKLRQAREKSNEIRKAHNKVRESEKKSPISKEVWEITLLNRALSTLQRGKVA